EAELRINRPFAPDIYRRVMAITREADGALKLDGAGTAVEWAGEMHRFDENAALDRLAPTGKIDAALSDALRPAGAALPAPRRRGRSRALDRGARRLYRAKRRCIPGAARPFYACRG